MRSAILITYPNEYAIKEAIALAESADYNVLKIVTQKYLTRSKYGIGKGKVDEIKVMVDELNADAIIFDEVIGPSQVYNLTSEVKREIIDRERLILDIFNKRAKSEESSIQVKLAELRYEITRAREKVRLSKKGEQPGFYGLGRYEVDDYYRDIKRRISILEKKLDKVKKRRELYRYHRKKEGLPNISLAGYTSAGKTTLFNALTNENRDTNEKIFTTLATHTSALQLEHGKALISDTVGFISKLPAYMIEAFKSTLDELIYADLILLVIDMSNDIKEILKKYDSCIDILNELNINQNKILYVYNKIELVNEEELYDKVNILNIDNYVTVSAKKYINIDLLLSKIDKVIFKDLVINGKNNCTKIRT